MIWGTWQDPNFKFRAVDKDGVPLEYICYAKSKEELESRLREMGGLTVESIEPYDFADWKRRAQAATKATCEAFHAGKRPIPFRQHIWAELKWHLFDLFHGKCAYCETKALPSSYGEVEHYRPKSKVEGDKPHPGYYWLAYDETNLLPSCGPCNQVNAKMNHFPVLGARARDAEGSLANEEPLLLNPFNRKIDPFDHLEFDGLGEAKARNGSPYGECSKKFYHLNRTDLFEARRTALKQVEQDWHTVTIALSSMGFKYQYRSLWTDISMGKRPYSAAQRWHLMRIAQSDRGENFAAGVERSAEP